MPSSSNDKPSSLSSATGGGKPATTQAAGDKSNFQMTKEGWGGRVSFQTSMGLKMTPDDIEEGNQILDAFRNIDAEQEASQRK